MTAQETPTLITKKQVRVIKMAQRYLNVDDAAYREYLGRYFGVDSCTRLSKVQANRVIKDFEKRGYKIKPAKPAPQRRPHGRGRGNLVALASAREQAKIQALAHVVEWRVAGGLERWMLKRFGFKRAKTAGQARDVIEGLKNMAINQLKKKYGPDWRASLSHSDIKAERRFYEEHLLK